MKITILAETTLDDDALRNLLGAFVQDVTKACQGRVVCLAGQVSEDDARATWDEAHLAEHPAPDAKPWVPKRERHQ